MSKKYKKLQQIYGKYDTEKLFIQLCKKNDIKGIKTILNQKSLIFSEYLSIACCYNCEIVECVLKMGYVATYEHLNIACRHSVKIVEILMNYGCQIKKNKLYNIQYNINPKIEKDIYNFFISKGFKLCERVMEIALHSNHLSTVKCLFDLKCPVPKEAIKYAALSCYTMIKFLLKKNCKITIDAITRSMRFAPRNAIKLLRLNNQNIKDILCDKLIKTACVVEPRVLDVLIDINCPYDIYTLDYCANSKYYNAKYTLKCLMINGPQEWRNAYKHVKDYTKVAPYVLTDNLCILPSVIVLTITDYIF